MQDHELYRRILGIEAPWCVESVELKLEVGEVHVHLAHQGRIDWPCPECGAPGKLYDHQPERKWRRLDTCQYRTIVHAQPPRSECSEHGVRVVKLPWAGSRSPQFIGTVLGGLPARTVGRARLAYTIFIMGVALNAALGILSLKGCHPDPELAEGEGPAFQPPAVEQKKQVPFDLAQGKPRAELLALGMTFCGDDWEPESLHRLRNWYGVKGF